MGCLKGGVLVRKRADACIERVPLGGAGHGSFLTFQVRALLALHVVRKQVLDRGRKVVAIEAGLLHQAFAEGEVDGALARGWNGGGQGDSPLKD